MTVITRLRTRGLRYPSGPLHRERWGPHEQACQVTVESDAGHLGSVIARAHCGMSYQALAESVQLALGPAVLGRRVDSVDDIQGVWQRMMHAYLAQYVPIFAVSAIDVALWDLLGRTRGTPVAALLNTAATAAHVPVYASLPHADSVAAVVDTAEQTLAAGFASVKVHGTADGDLDRQICRALREKFGDGTGLMYDGGRLLTRDGARDLGGLLDGLGYAWLEEPFGPFDHESYRWLARECPIPVAAFETAPGGPGATAWAIGHRLATYLLVDCYWKGGLTGARQVVHNAAAAGQSLIMHHGASSTMNVANLHLVAAYPELGQAEFLVPYGLYDVGSTVLPITPGAGVRVPTGPGLGIELDEGFLDRHAIPGSAETTSATVSG